MQCAAGPSVSKKFVVATNCRSKSSWPGSARLRPTACRVCALLARRSTAKPAATQPGRGAMQHRLLALQNFDNSYLRIASPDNKEAGPTERNRPSYRETTMMAAKLPSRAPPQIHKRQSSAPYHSQPDQ